ncbi:hypothetical protein N7475_008509 [Penicillium sp. IBT 31633x]|nr:hypothetical protein N7475_008509 [Penicillium sp. IBT 31633x]
MSDSTGQNSSTTGASTRAPKPAAFIWDKNQIDRGSISPVRSTEGLQTPNEATKYMRHPSSPDSSSHLPPRMHSPASQIFERDVQEDIVSAQASPSIPAHIRTENYIPPVLEASSVAITDDHLDPDSVEIVTHSLHQPAGGAPGEQSMSSSIDHLLNQTDTEELPLSYAAPETTDVRRLSFISFADVVNAEHAETNEAHPGAMSRERLGDLKRSPSPLRSPSSHGMGTSPPTSIATSSRGLDMSPTRFPVASSAQSPVSPSFGGDLNVETMRQALRKTASGDLGITSQAVSTIGDDSLDRTF